MPRFCEVGYSATLPRAQGHNFKINLLWGKVVAVEGSECNIKRHTDKKLSSHCITNVFFTTFHSILTSDNASAAPLYPESDHEAIDLKRPCAQLLRRIPTCRVIQPGFFCSFLQHGVPPSCLCCSI